MATKRICRDTVDYVGNISKYYAAYHLIVENLELKEKARQEMGGKSHEQLLRPFTV